MGQRDDWTGGDDVGVGTRAASNESRREVRQMQARSLMERALPTRGAAEGRPTPGSPPELAEVGEEPVSAGDQTTASAEARRAVTPVSTPRGLERGGKPGATQGKSPHHPCFGDTDAPMAIGRGRRSLTGGSAAVTRMSRFGAASGWARSHALPRKRSRSRRWRERDVRTDARRPRSHGLRAWE